MYQELADMACNRITAGITRQFLGERPIKALLDPYNPDRLHRARAFQHFTRPIAGKPRPTAAEPRQLGHPRQRLGGGVLPRGRIAPAGARLYARTTISGSEVPYRYGSETRKYLPDFIVLVDDGHGQTTRCISSSRSRAIGARMRRKRNPRWRPTGFPA